jgi:hypothetical protein
MFVCERERRTHATRRHHLGLDFVRPHDARQGEAVEVVLVRQAENAGQCGGLERACNSLEREQVAPVEKAGDSGKARAQAAINQCIEQVLARRVSCSVRVGRLALHLARVRCWRWQCW